MRKTKENNQGITLIALVVTIVVLLILAAVSIGMLTGENGIIKQAQKSKEETIIADEKEILNLAYMACKQDNMINDMFEEIVTNEQLQKELENNKRNTTVTSVGEDLEVIFNDTNHKYVIYQDGTIEQIENLSPEEANKIVDIVAYCENGVYVLTAEGKIKKANVIAGNIFDTLQVTDDSEIITENGVREKGGSYFIDNKGKVYTWGRNYSGQLGDGTYNDSNKPICISDIPGNVLNGKNIIEIYNEGSTIIALDAQAKVYTWGSNYNGQLGNGTNEDSNVPICISDIIGNEFKGKKIIDINNGGDTIVAIDEQGKVYTWGYNISGQLGNGTNEDSNAPRCISDIIGNALNGKKITEIYSDGYTIIALDTQGKVYTWGSNYKGQLGDGTDNYSNKPICISDIPENALNGRNITKIYNGESTIIALDTQGKVYTWGSNYNGKLGDGTDNDSNKPICISDIPESALNGKNITEIYNNGSTIIALDTLGKVYIWGRNNYGQLGNGTSENYSNEPICISDIPENALNGKNITEIYNNGSTIIALDTQGKVYTWGYNFYGKLGDGTYDNSNEPICINDISGSELNGNKVREYGELIYNHHPYYSFMLYYILESNQIYFYDWIQEAE